MMGGGGFDEVVRLRKQGFVEDDDDDDDGDEPASNALSLLSTVPLELLACLKAQEEPGLRARAFINAVTSLHCLNPVKRGSKMWRGKVNKD